MVWAPESHFERHLPFALLTGFLGSGKTTLLNHLLTDPRMRDTAVAINEFGDVALDQHFIVARDDDVLVLANGCLCCFAPDDLERSLARIFSRREAGELPAFKRLVIETSGLADPEFVLQAVLDAPLASRFLWLDSIVTTVDCLFGIESLDQHAEAEKQGRLADRFVITKSDMTDADGLSALSARLRQLNPGAGRHVAMHGVIDPRQLFSATFFDDDASRSLVGDWIAPPRAAPDSGTGADDRETHAHHSHETETVTITADTPLDWRTFDLWLGRMQRELGDALLRVKGIVNVAGQPAPVVVHGVRSVAHVPVALDQWPDADRRTRVVFILRGARAADVRARWNEFTGEDAAAPA